MLVQRNAWHARDRTRWAEFRPRFLQNMGGAHTTKVLALEEISLIGFHRGLARRFALQHSPHVVEKIRVQNRLEVCDKCCCLAYRYPPPNLAVAARGLLL